MCRALAAARRAKLRARAQAAERRQRLVRDQRSRGERVAQPDPFGGARADAGATAKDEQRRRRRRLSARTGLPPSAMTPAGYMRTPAARAQTATGCQGVTACSPCSLARSPLAAPQPTIVQKPIPFPSQAQAGDGRLRAPPLRDRLLPAARSEGDRRALHGHVDLPADVEHVRARPARTRSCASCPGTCAHYVIDRDGTIYQLVPRSIMCRHTVGLNYTAIGIEHVGFSDARDPAQRAARWRPRCGSRAGCAAATGSASNNVIGHSESRSLAATTASASRGCSNQTHGDWSRASMRTYRSRLARTRHMLSTLGSMRIAASVTLLLCSGRGGRRGRGAAAAPEGLLLLQGRSSTTRATGALRTQGGVGVVGRAAPPPVDAIATPPIAPPPPAMDTTPAAPAPPAPAPVVGREGVGGSASRTSPAPTRRRSTSTSPTSSRPTAGGSSPSPTARCGSIDAATGARDRDARARRLRAPAAAARRPRAGDRDQGRAPPSPIVGRPVAPDGRAACSSTTIVTEIDVSGRAEGDAHDGGRRAASSTRARTAPSRGS